MSKTLQVGISQKVVSLHGRELKILGENAFTVESGTFVSILGKSGCGKSTVLRLISGLDLNYDGELLLGGKPIEGPGLDRGIVFQDPRLMPWMTVWKNIEFAIPERRRNKQSLNHVKQLVELVGLSSFKDAWPNQLSGGMAQRVALARALVNIPDLLLLDEPFGALDNYTKMLMQSELEKIVQKEGVTTLLVTHDVDEAIFLSDKIIIMSEQPGSTRRIIDIDLIRPRERISRAFIELRNMTLNEAYSSQPIRAVDAPVKNQT